MEIIDSQNQLLFDLPFEGIFIHENGKILAVNLALSEMLGYKVSELVSKEALNFVAVEYRNKMFEHFRSQSETLYELEFVRKDGTTFIAEVRGKACIYQGRKARVKAVRDITEHKRAEEAARLGYAELEQIFNTAADGMLVIDKDFNVLRINQTFSRLSGKSRDEAVGKKCYESFSSWLCHTSSCPLTQILNGEERVEYEVEKKRTDCTKILCIMTATPFRGLDGELVCIVTLHDKNRNLK